MENLRGNIVFVLSYLKFPPKRYILMYFLHFSASFYPPLHYNGEGSIALGINLMAVHFDF